MRNIVCARTWLALAAAALVLGLFGGMLSAPTVALASESLQDGVSVAVSPPQVNLNCGETETVDIRISNVTDLFGVDIKVSYDPNVVEVLLLCVVRGVAITTGCFFPGLVAIPGRLPLRGIALGLGIAAFRAARNCERDPIPQPDASLQTGNPNGVPFQSQG